MEWIWVHLHILIIKKDILFLGKGPTQALQHTLPVENFSQSKNTGFCLSLNYNRANSNLFVSGTEITKFKAKDSEIKPYHLCLGDIETNFSVDNMKKTELKRYV